MHIFAAAITIAPLANTPTVQIARLGLTRHTPHPTTTSTSAIPTAEGNRAAKTVGPKTIIAPA
jgi:hypothetical protein